MRNLAHRVLDYIRCHGVGYTLRRGAEKLDERIMHRYDRVWRIIRTSDEELKRQRADSLDVGGISVVIPVYNTRVDFLKELVQSLLEQTYPHWQACLYDGASTSEETVAALDELSRMDSRLCVCHGASNEGISGNSNRALAMATGAWIALCDHDDLLTPDALYRVAQVIQNDAPDMIYSDEDKITENGAWHTDPHFKPDFCPDNLRSGNYICHLMVMRKTLLEKAGGFRPAFDGSQDHDLALRLSEHTTRIAHIPHVLYHWRTVGSSMSHQNMMRCVTAACAAVQEHMTRIGWPGTATPENGNIRLRYDIQGNPSVDVIMLSDSDETVRRCQDALSKATAFKANVLSVHPGDHFYAAINRAAASSQADFLLVMDASVVVETPDFITELLMYAQRDDVGAVTPELVDRHGKITHGGFAVGMEGIAQCREQGLPYHAGGWHLLMMTSHNVAAVSAACVMIRKDHFIPFDEAYHSGLGAVDWSLRLGERGLHHVFTPHARAVCENRGLLLLDQSRDLEDVKRLTEGAPLKDPCYSEIFSRNRANYGLPSRKALERGTGHEA